MLLVGITKKNFRNMKVKPIILKDLVVNLVCRQTAKMQQLLVLMMNKATLEPIMRKTSLW